jgi:lysophospholipase L1-like esterase
VPHNVAMTPGPSPLRRRRAPGLALLGLALVSGLGLTACSTPSTTPPRAEGGAAPAAASGDLRVAVVGDSLSAGRSRFLGNGLDDKSWMTYAQGDGIEFAGGWAKAGATVEEMAAAVSSVDADLLVLMGGTNDVRFGTPFAEAQASYESIIETVGADRVLIAAIPPYERAPEAAADYDADLATWAYGEGYPVIDPWVFARGDDGLFAPGTSADGIHPTYSGYVRLGRAFHDLILETTAPTDVVTSGPEAADDRGVQAPSAAGALVG